jgi:hypothetical protein
MKAVNLYSLDEETWKGRKKTLIQPNRRDLEHSFFRMNPLDTW